MKRRAVLLLILALACRREEPPPAAAPAVPAENNLLHLARGASVVFRTAEHTYESSASHAIDDDIVTQWASPSGGPDQTLVYALPARSRIRRFGAVVAMGSQVQQLRIESSLDGKAWTPMAQLGFKPDGKVQMHDVTPFEARYLRLTTIGTGQRFCVLNSLIVGGEELEPPRVPPIDGCWTINSVAARFEQRGAHVAGVIGDENPIQLDGGFDGRVYRFTWRRGPQWGYALLTVSPDGTTISGMRWHEVIHYEGAGDGWFGTRGACAKTPFDPDAIRTRILGESKRYPLLGLRFDERDRLMTDESAATLEWLARQNDLRLAGSAAAIESLRGALGVTAKRFDFVRREPPASGSLPEKVLHGNVAIETR